MMIDRSAGGSAGTIEAPAAGYQKAVKRSVTIAGHETSIALEPVFWDALDSAARARELPLNALIAAIDHARIGAADPPNLASAIRIWLMSDTIRDKVENHSH
jgi:predicted DNA-binding ribbon-helix-helix protein